MASSTPRSGACAAREFIDYFNSLVDAGTYMSVDAMNDPVLQPMRASYLSPTTSSRCSTPRSSSTTRPTAWCAARSRSRRAWSQSDVVSLRAIVNKIALLMWNAPDSVLLSTPSLPLRVVLQHEPSAPADRRR